MAVIGWYCKAFEALRFKEFPGWSDLTAARVSASGPINDEDILYLHEDFAVTDGAIREDNVIVDNPPEAWQQFCREVLEFSVPDYMYVPDEVLAADDAAIAQAEEAAAASTPQS